MRRTLLYIIPLCALLACNRAELVDVIELGATEKEIFLSTGAEDGAIGLLTNVPYRAEVISGEDWLLLAGSGMMPATRTEIPFRCEVNQGFKRTAKVTLSAGSRIDTVFIRQNGALADRISLEKKTFEVPASGGNYSTPVECFRHPEGLLLDISAPTAIQAEYRDGALFFTVAPATARDPKTYTIDVYYLDGWGQRASAIATINQEARKN